MKKAVESVQRKPRRDFRNDERPARPEPKPEVKVTKTEVKEEPKKEVETVKEDKKVEKADSKDLSSKTVAELREMAKDKDIKGYSTMKKAELVDALK